MILRNRNEDRHVKRPLPDSEGYEEYVRLERRRRVRRLMVIALLAGSLALVAYLLLGGELPDPPAWVRAL